MTTEPVSPHRPDYAGIDVQVVRCPYCRKPVRGLLAGCPKDGCRRREIAEDHAYTRSQDL